MRYARDYRQEAYLKTKPQAGALAIIILIVTIINAIISIQIPTGEVQEFLGYEIKEYTQPLSIISFFIAGPLAVSYIGISKKVYFEEKVNIKDLLYGFKDFGRNFIASVLMDLYIALWSLISFGILGIIKAYSYSMTYFLLDENKDLSVNEAITLSRELMNGNKWRLFCLELSYIGWYILCALTLGVLTLWVQPRVLEARYIFFKEIYEESGRRVNIENKIEVLDSNSYTNNYSK